MGWMSKLIERHNNKAKCLICEKTVSQDAAVVEYRYDGGTGQAFLCAKCEEEMNNSKLDDIDDEAI